MYQWRKFEFFEEKAAGRGGAPSVPAEIAGRVTCCSGGRGRVALGCDDGTVGLLDRDFRLSYGFQAYASSVLFLQQLKQRNVLVTVGDDDQASSQGSAICLKVFDLDKVQEEGSSATSPFCVQILRIFTNQFPQAKGVRDPQSTTHTHHTNRGKEEHTPQRRREPPHSKPDSHTSSTPPGRKEASTPRSVASSPNNLVEQPHKPSGASTAILPMNELRLRATASTTLLPRAPPSSPAERNHPPANSHRFVFILAGLKRGQRTAKSCGIRRSAAPKSRPRRDEAPESATAGEEARRPPPSHRHHRRLPDAAGGPLPRPTLCTGRDPGIPTLPPPERPTEGRNPADPRRARWPDGGASKIAFPDTVEGERRATDSSFWTVDRVFHMHVCLGKLMIMV